MTVLIAERTVKARKDHECKLCGQRAVVKGEQYTYRTWVYDGSVFNWIDCVSCRVVIRKVFETLEPDEGVTTDVADDWALDCRKTDEDASAYLSRRGYTDVDYEE